jgi:S1-C subfamily serine protease
MHQMSVVRVFTTSMSPSFRVPWQMESTENSTGSGVYLGQNKILTGAHVVNNATFIQVQSLFSDEKYVAHVTSISHDCDLALLSLEEPEVFQEVPAASLGELPELKSPVEVVGFPMGGEQVSITNGVLSRVEVNQYSHSGRQLLCATIDAAINPGNSGGPVFNQAGEVVGIAFQKDMDSENSGHIVPAVVIQNFLKGASRGSELVRFPSLGVALQDLDNPALRAHFKVPQGKTGVLITSVAHGSSVWGVLQEGDVLHKIDEYEVSHLSTINYRGRYRTDIRARLSELGEGDKLKVVFSRQGELMEVELTLRAGEHLVSRERPLANRYCVFAGLVFQPLSYNFLERWPRQFMYPTELKYLYELGERAEGRQEVVVLSHVLSDKLNVGYEDLVMQVVQEVNNVKVRDFAHFVSLLDHAEGLVRLKTTQQMWLVVSCEEARAREGELLTRYHIPQARVL